MRERAQNQITIKLSELMYLVYFSVMLFAKGIGLYDGQIMYKMFLLVALACIAIKMCITEYTSTEWIIILTLLVVSTIVYCVSGEKGILICVVTVVGMKQVSLERVFRTGMSVWMLAMGGRFLVSFIFWDRVQTAVQTKNFFGALLRYFMGYPHPNVLHISYFVLTAFIVFCLKDCFNVKHVLLLMIGNCIVFLYSYSFTGILIVTVYLMLSLQVRMRKITKAEYWITEAVFPVCALFSVIFPIVVMGKIYELADKFFNNRINFARHFLTLENMKLFGNNLAEITTDTVTMDNSFVFALVIYGVPVFLLICVGYILTIHNYVKQQRKMELAMFCCFLIAGITEPFLFNTSFKNLTLLFVGEQLFVLLGQRGEKGRALLKGDSQEFTIPIEGITNLKRQITIIWNDYARKMVVISTLISTGIGIIVGIFYQPGEAVLEVQRDNLLLFERMRIIATAFAVAWWITVLILLKVYCLKGQKLEGNEDENHA